MAGNKSSEGMVTYKCMKCFAEMSVSNRRENSMDGRSCFLCKGPINKAENKINVGDIKVRMDFSESITGLKAIQREARKAIKVLRELEEQQKRVIQ